MIGRERQIGLDIGHAWVKAALRDRSGHISRAAAFPRESDAPMPDADEVIGMAETLLRLGFEPDPVVIGVGSRDLRLEEIEAPPVPDEHARDRIIFGEIGRLAHWDAGSYTGQWWQVPAPARASAGATYLSVATPTSTLDAIVNPLIQAGFDIRAVDMRAAASGRLCARKAAADQLIVTVDVGWSCVEIAAMFDHRLVFVRRLDELGLSGVCGQMPSVRLGQKLVFESLALGRCEPLPAWRSARASYGVACRSLGQSLERELTLTLGYLARRFPSAATAEVVVLGGGARLEALLEPLQSTNEFVARRGVPGELASVRSKPSAWADEPMFVTACGLALWDGEDHR